MSLLFNNSEHTSICHSLMPPQTFPVHLITVNSSSTCNIFTLYNSLATPSSSASASCDFAGSFASCSARGFNWAIYYGCLMNYFILFDLTWCFNNIRNHNCQNIDRISILFVEVQIPNGDCPTQALVCLFTMYNCILSLSLSTSPFAAGLNYNLN